MTSVFDVGSAGESRSGAHLMSGLCYVLWSTCVPGVCYFGVCAWSAEDDSYGSVYGSCCG